MNDRIEVVVGSASGAVPLPLDVPDWGIDPYATGDEKMGKRLEDHLLAGAFLKSLERAAAEKLDTVSFPIAATKFPVERAATIAVGHVRSFLARSPSPRRVIFACESELLARIYRSALAPRDFTKPIVLDKK